MNCYDNTNKVNFNSALSNNVALSGSTKHEVLLDEEVIQKVHDSSGPIEINKSDMLFYYWNSGVTGIVQYDVNLANPGVNDLNNKYSVGSNYILWGNDVETRDIVFSNSAYTYCGWFWVSTINIPDGVYTSPWHSRLNSAAGSLNGFRPYIYPDSDTSGHKVLFSCNGAVMTLGNSDMPLNSIWSLTSQTWHHLAITNNPTTNRKVVYLDGKLQHCEIKSWSLWYTTYLSQGYLDPGTESTNSPDANSRWLVFTHERNSIGFEERHKNFMVFNKTLNSNEVKYLYDNGPDYLYN